MPWEDPEESGGVGGGMGVRDGQYLQNHGADSCQCMAKTLKYCKVINLKLIKINENKITIIEKRNKKEEEKK